MFLGLLPSGPVILRSLGSSHTHTRYWLLGGVLVCWVLAPPVLEPPSLEAVPPLGPPLPAGLREVADSACKAMAL